MMINNASTPVADLPNLGPASVRWLKEIGVSTRGELAAMGAVAAYCLIHAQHEGTSLNLLYALYGALHNRRWHSLPAEVKTALQEEVAGFHFGEI